MVQASQRKRHRQEDTEETYQSVVRVIRTLPRTVMPRLLHEIAQVMEQDVISATAGQDGNSQHQQASLHNALVILTKHQLDHSDSTDEDKLLDAQSVMLNALREGKLNREIFERAELEARRVLGMDTEDDGESPLVRRALTRPDEGLPVPTDKELEQWRDEYLMEKYGG